VLTPDIEDERDLRLERDEIREVLIRADAEVDASRFGDAEEIGDHPLIRRLARHEIVRAKVSAGLGEIGHQLPEITVAELGGNALRRRGDGGGGGSERDSQREAPRGETCRDEHANQNVCKTETGEEACRLSPRRGDRQFPSSTTAHPRSLQSLQNRAYCHI